MNVISKPGLQLLGSRHPETITALTVFYTVTKKAEWHGLHQVRIDFPAVDQVGQVLVFNILGNRYRLITTVNYGRQQVFVKDLLTHREYERKGWMKWAQLH